MDEEGFNVFDSKQLIVILAVCAVVLGGVVYYWWEKTVTPKYSSTQLQAIDQAEQRLLTQISTSAKTATLKNTIPATSAQVANPVDSVYRNPFQ